MSFSFRNLFSPDDNSEQASTAAPMTAGRGFGPVFQEYQVSQLLNLIPPAFAVRGHVPVEESVRIPMAEGGSRDVRLSAIYQACPRLFSTEITPQNDSIIHLPPPMTPHFAGQPSPNFNPFGDVAAEESPFAPSSRDGRPDERELPWAKSSANDRAPSNPFASPAFPQSGAILPDQPFGGAPEHSPNPFASHHSLDEILAQQSKHAPAAPQSKDSDSPHLSSGKSNAKATQAAVQNPFEMETGSGFSSLFMPPKDWAPQREKSPSPETASPEQAAPSPKAAAPAPSQAMSQLFNETKGELFSGTPGAKSKHSDEEEGFKPFIPPGMDQGASAEEFLPPQVTWRDEETFASLPRSAPAESSPLGKELPGAKPEESTPPPSADQTQVKKASSPQPEPFAAPASPFFLDLLPERARAPATRAFRRARFAGFEIPF